MLNFENVKFVSVQSWNKFVTEVYGRPYHLQQQQGCMPRGIVSFEVAPEDLNKPTVRENPEMWVNYGKDTLEDSEDMEVSFHAWLACDPSKPIPGQQDKADNKRWWYRRFYPSIYDIVVDLAARSLIEPGHYVINIDW